MNNIQRGRVTCDTDDISAVAEFWRRTGAPQLGGMLPTISLVVRVHLHIQTSALTMGPEYSDEKVPKLLGYQVSQVITVILTDVSKYEDLMASSLRAGVNRVDGINFFIADPKKYREEARLQAVRAAREKAKAMATELGQTIGKPWEVTEEPDIDAQDVTANLYMRYKMPMQQEQSTVAGGEVKIRALVRVSFQLD